MHWSFHPSFRPAVFFVVAAGLAMTSAPGVAAPYYEGKTFSLIVGAAPGGGSDITARLIARHLGKHVAGHPKIIVRNLPGAGQAIAANYAGEVARPNGLTAYWGSAPVSIQLLGDPALRVDLRKFHIIGGSPGTQVVYITTAVKPGMKIGTDIFRATNLVIGGFRVTNTKDLRTRLGLDLLGVKYKYVTGFRGNSRARAAIHQKIISGFMEGLPSYNAVTIPTMVKTGMVIPVYQTGRPDDNGVLVRDPDAPGIPTLAEFYKAKFGKMPSGLRWDALEVLSAPGNVAQRWMGVTPGSPKEAVAALRTGMNAMSKDPAFLKESVRVMKLKMVFYSGEVVQKTIASALSAPPEVLNFLRKYAESGKKAARH